MLRPEDRRRRQVVVEVEAAVDLGKPVLDLTVGDHLGPAQHHRERAPDGVVVGGGESVECLGSRSHRREVEPPEVQQGRVPERVGARVRVPDLVGDGQAALQPGDRAVWEAGPPQQEARHHVGHDAGARPDAELHEARRSGVEVLDGGVEVLQAVVDVAEERGVHPVDQVRFGQQHGVALLLGDREQLAADLERAVEVRPHEVQGREAAQYWEALGGVVLLA